MIHGKAMVLGLMTVALGVVIGCNAKPAEWSGEQAAIAFVFLVDRRVTPIDYMERTNADHAFVVIDRKVGSDVKDISTWGDTAVVCDPWDEKVYAASEIPSKMYGGGTFAPRSVYRHQ